MLDRPRRMLSPAAAAKPPFDIAVDHENREREKLLVRTAVERTRRPKKRQKGDLL